MSIIIVYILIFLAFSCKEGCAQSNSRQSDSLMVIALPDVEVTNSSTRLVISSGTEDNKTTHIISPGGGHAIRFLAPKSNYHELGQLRLHLKNISKLREGQLRVRITSVTEDGSPADDSLLAPVILNTKGLQHAHHHMTLQWHNGEFFVPERGFFIVIEGLGQTADEFVSGAQTTGKSKTTLRYNISRRAQPDVVIRTADADGFPQLKGTKPDPNSAISWYRDTVTRQWRANRSGRSVLLVEAIFH